MRDAVLVLGATMRLTRFVVTDTLGAWLIRDQVDAAMVRYEEREYEAAENEGRDVREPWWWKYREGLECPWCVGFWIGVGVLGSYHLVGRGRAWQFVATALTLNEVSARLGTVLGDFDEH